MRNKTGENGRRRRSKRRGGLVALRGESLESRELLAFDFVATLSSETSQAPIAGNFGEAIASELLTVIGAPHAEVNGVEKAGTVRVYGRLDDFLVSLENPDPDTNDQFGAAVAIYGSNVYVAAPNDDSNGGTVYVFDVFSSTPNIPVETIHHPGAAQGNFGSSLSYDVDSDQLAVGAEGDLSNGKVYIYDTDDLSAPLHILGNPNSVGMGNFGASVDMACGKVVVGDPFDNTGASRAGRAYVYDMSGPNPSFPVHKIDNPFPGISDQFGDAVEIVCDYVVIGAFKDDTGILDSGSVYAYELADTTTPFRRLGSPDPQVFEYFGTDIALEVDFSGEVTVSVGAPGFNSVDSFDVGRVYEFELTDLSGAYSVHENPEPLTNDRFGTRVVHTRGKLYVGAPLAGEGTFLADPGAAYVFRGNRLDRKFLNSDSDQLTGNAVAVNDDWIVVGQKQGLVEGMPSGRVHIYDNSGASPSLVAIIDNPTGELEGEFGDTVALDGNTLVVGAPLNLATNWGLTYVFDIAGGNPELQQTITSPFVFPGIRFGGGLAIDEDMIAVGTDNVAGQGFVAVYDRNGIDPGTPILVYQDPTALIASRLGSVLALDDGKLVVGEVAPGEPAAVRIVDVATGSVLRIEGPQSPGYSGLSFGSSVALDGEILVVGAPWYNDSVGITYVYDLGDSNPAIPVFTIQNPDPSGFGDRFGAATAIEGDTVVVSAKRADGTGRSFVYDLASPNPVSPSQAIDNPSPGVGDEFGQTIALHGETLVVGTPFDDREALDQGSASVYRRSLADPGDVNQDGQVNASDIDELTAQIAGGGGDLAYDLNADEVVDSADIDVWLSIAGELNLGPGLSYIRGDANLDGVVDASDFNAWNANKFTNIAAWSKGDLTADGVVDASDFNIWNAHKFQSSNRLLRSVASDHGLDLSTRDGSANDRQDHFRLDLFYFLHGLSADLPD